MPARTTTPHYAVKIEAVQLLLENLSNTFTTPVFNGSASLRNAAGQLVEEVTKSIRRHQTVDDASIAQLYTDTEALYHLDSVSVSGSAKTDLGPLPPTAVALLAALGAAWACILGVLWWAVAAQPGGPRGKIFQNGNEFFATGRKRLIFAGFPAIIKVFGLRS